jgi:hypothetical protein
VSSAKASVWLAAASILAHHAAAQVTAPRDSAAVAVIAEALAVGEAHARSAAPAAPRRPNFVADHGSAERRCVEVGDAAARSGEFVLLPGSHPLRSQPPPAPPLRGNFSLVPRSYLKYVPISGYARSLNNPELVVEFSFTGWIYRYTHTSDYVHPPEPERAYFTPIPLTFPTGGEWLIVVAHAENWGCFIVNVA